MGSAILVKVGSGGLETLFWPLKIDVFTLKDELRNIRPLIGLCDNSGCTSPRKSSLRNIRPLIGLCDLAQAHVYTQDRLLRNIRPLIGLCDIKPPARRAKMRSQKHSPANRAL